MVWQMRFVRIYQQASNYIKNTTKRNPLGVFPKGFCVLDYFPCSRASVMVVVSQTSVGP